MRAELAAAFPRHFARLAWAALAFVTALNGESVVMVFVALVIAGAVGALGTGR